MEDRREVQRDHVVPSLWRKLGQGRDVLDASIIHQDVDASERLVREGDQLMDLFGPGEIGAVIADVDVIVRGEPVLDRLDLGGITKSVQEHAGSRGGELLGDSQADSAGRAGHESGLAGERRHFLQFPVLEDEGSGQPGFSSAPFRGPIREPGASREWRRGRRRPRRPGHVLGARDHPAWAR